MILRNTVSVIIVTVCLVGSGSASAQSVAGVFSPVVNAGHVSAEYRLGYVPDGERSVHRLHYQRAVNDDVMWRIAAQGRRTPGAPFDLDILGAEVTWQITDNASDWQSGLRFDLRYSDPRNVGMVGVNWGNEFKLAERLSLRLIGLTSMEIGKNARNGVFLQSRTRLAWSAGAGTVVAVESFNVYGSTAGFPKLRNQTHQTGPVISFRAGEKWQVFVGLLAGLTSASPNEEIRFRFGRRF